MIIEGQGPVPTEWPSLPEPYRPEQFLDLVSQVAKIDRDALVPSATMASLNIASLDMVDILFELEERFDVYVPMGDELANIVYLADFVAVLADLIRTGAAEAAAGASAATEA